MLVAYPIEPHGFDKLFLPQDNYHDIVFDIKLLSCGQLHGNSIDDFKFEHLPFRRIEDRQVKAANHYLFEFRPMESVIGKGETINLFNYQSGEPVGVFVIEGHARRLADCGKMSSPN